MEEANVLAEEIVDTKCAQDEEALINKLPEEILEKIFSFTSQYR